MATRTDNECVWDLEPTGRTVWDDWAEAEVEEFDYVPMGTLRPSPFEEMVYISSGVQAQFIFEPEW